MGVIAVFENPDQETISLLKSLKLNNSLKFKGVIKGDWLRSLVIDPAIIIKPETDEFIIGDKKLLTANYSVPYSFLNDLILKAENGDAQAAYRAGTLLNDFPGDNYQESRNQALKYLKMAEKQGIIYARAMRARIKYSEAYDDKDSDEMEKLSNEAKQIIKILKPYCDEGISEAQFITGRLYIIVLNNEKLGMQYYEEARKNKNMDACKYLGNIYTQKDDFELGEKYYTQCINYGEEFCKKKLKSLFAKKENFSKDGIQTIEIKFTGRSGSEFNGYIDGKDNKENDVSFVYSYDNGELVNKIEKLREGSKYNVEYKIRYFNDEDPSEGKFFEIIGITKSGSASLPKDKKNSKKELNKLNKLLKDIEKEADFL